MAAIFLKNVSLDRDHFSSERTLNLEIRDREFVVLTGPAGCGLSRILRMIAGLEATTGEVFLDERLLDAVPPKDRDVALIAKGYEPYPRMSVFDNLAFGLRRRRLSKPEVEKRVRAAAEIAGLKELLEDDGQLLDAETRQRIALARAMVLQPKVFLYDEPFSTLEPKAQMAGRAEIKKLYQRLPATMIYATHDPMEAMAMGGRLVVIAQGIVQQDGNAQSVYDESANLFVAGFIGKPGMNLVHGLLKQDRDALVFVEAGDGTIQLRLPSSRFAKAREFAGKPVVLGLRPEDVEVSPSPAERSATGFRALVEMVEAKGEGVDLHLQTGAHSLVCRSRRGNDHGPGGYRAQFEVNLEKAHLYDAESEALITANA
jgi:multiple sugar transport system ATP-binding protein